MTRKHEGLKLKVNIIQNINLGLQLVLALVGILAVVISLYKIMWPKLDFKVLSVYETFDQNGRELIVLKVRTTSNVDLVIKNLNVKMGLSDGAKLPMAIFQPRWKTVLFVMKDINGDDANYKILKPLEPDLINNGIKQGSNEYFLKIRSVDAGQDKKIAWLDFDVCWSNQMLPVPDITFFSHKTMRVYMPDEKDLYFDDSLFQKITAEERETIISSL